MKVLTKEMMVRAFVIKAQETLLEHMKGEDACECPDCDGALDFLIKIAEMRERADA